MRLGEIMSLTWNQVDLTIQRITLYVIKNGDIRVLPLVDHALEVMRERSKVRRIDTNLVFASRLDPHKAATIRSPSVIA